MSSFSYKQGFRDGFLVFPPQVYQLPEMQLVLSSLPSYSEKLPAYFDYQRGHRKGTEAALRLWERVPMKMAKRRGYKDE